MSQKNVHKKIFKPNKDEQNGWFKILHDKKLCDLYLIGYLLDGTEKITITEFWLENLLEVWEGYKKITLRRLLGKHIGWM